MRSCFSGVSRFSFFGCVVATGFFRTCVRELHFGRVAFLVFRACRPVTIFSNICSQLVFRACRHSGISGVLFPIKPFSRLSGISQETLRKIPANSQVHFLRMCERSPEFPNACASANSQIPQNTSERASAREFPNDPHPTPARIPKLHMCKPRPR
jgi:hypothetical protein